MYIVICPWSRLSNGSVSHKRFAICVDVEDEEMNCQTAGQSVCAMTRGAGRKAFHCSTCCERGGKPISKEFSVLIRDHLTLLLRAAPRSSPPGKRAGQHGRSSHDMRIRRRLVRSCYGQRCRAPTRHGAECSSTPLIRSTVVFRRDDDESLLIPLPTPDTN